MRTYWRDLGERVVATYFEAYCGILLAAPLVERLTDGTIDLSMWHTAAVAATPAALAVIKAAAAKRIGQPDSASMLPGKG